MSEPIASTPPVALPKLSQERGFVSIELSKTISVLLPVRTPGLLAFLYVDGDSETVIKLLMLEDLAKGFVENRLFCGRANYAAYYVFAEESDYDLRVVALAARLQFFAQLTEKYNAPQTAERFSAE